MRRYIKERCPARAWRGSAAQLQLACVSIQRLLSICLHGERELCGPPSLPPSPFPWRLQCRCRCGDGELPWTCRQGHVELYGVERGTPSTARFFIWRSPGWRGTMHVAGAPGEGLAVQALSRGGGGGGAAQSARMPL